MRVRVKGWRREGVKSGMGGGSGGGEGSGEYKEWRYVRVGHSERGMRTVEVGGGGGDEGEGRGGVGIE